ncbi:centrosomal protein of 164 kDa isoform X1 [Euwallacea fornicatus]|uniref:centrosomal protein of 164 kDa isoform X1 n=1 Tax=Euwallacea fornicatus TaxID=995702 RepID=UPI00338FB714
MSTVCEEVFDETSHPSVQEIKDYAVKIGIDPDSEPQLLPLATEGLMKALPAGWKPCYDEKSKSYYYYNLTTKKTQWEHPLDDVYRSLVKKARAESQSLSLNEPTEDATYAKEDELKSFEESLADVQKLQPLSLVSRKRDIRLSPLKLSPAHSPRHESKLLKQRSEDILVGSNKFLHKFSSFDEENKEVGVFDKHPKVLERMELKVTGGGSMFLKSNTKKGEPIPSPAQRSEGLDAPKSILRAIEHSKSMDFDKVSLADRSDKDDDDKKSVRFNLENMTDVGITFSDKSSSEEEIINSDKQPKDEVVGMSKNRFSVSPVPEKSGGTLRLIKVPPDFVTPKLTINYPGSESDEDTKSLEKLELKKVGNMFHSDSDSSPDERVKSYFEARADKKVAQFKQKLWEEKNGELVNFKLKLEESHKHELDTILEEEKLKHEQIIKTEVDSLKSQLDARTKEERLNFDRRIKELAEEVDGKLKGEQERIKQHYEFKKEELEKYYEDKLVEIEKELAERVEKQKDDFILNHNAEIEQLRQNHSILIEELKREFLVEEQILKQDHQAEMTEMRNLFLKEGESLKSKNSGDDRQFEKIRCEKRLLEDKYRCLKEKYLRLKTEVKLSLDKRNRRKEQNSTNNTTTNTTGSETEQSHSNNKERYPLKPPYESHLKHFCFFRTPLNSPSKKILLDKPPTPSNNIKTDAKIFKVQELDTSVSDNCYQSDEKANQNDSSDSTNPAKGKKKLFSRLKSSSTVKTNNLSSKSRRNHQRSCSPVENLRKQLQKLEDLEDQFPQNSQSDTYHLRYPFSDGQKFEGSSELEFFRHRIHLERDSIKRAKESLRSQKALFQQRQKELKLKHGSMARHTLQQLCQEEKELTDMEVNLHRTRSLLGEKVIRLRHLEQSLHRANVQNDQSKLDDATLSDISSHSASSGISSTEFLAAEIAINNHHPKAISKSEFQEPSEIIQSLENLNSEIREIWDVLRTQQQQTSIAQVIPPLVYPDLGWPVLAGSANVPAPPSIPTLADRLHNYRQHVALANAQSTVVTHASQGATTTLIERTRNLRHWLRQNGNEACTEANPTQTNL